jgi:hypothetical protein
VCCVELLLFFIVFYCCLFLNDMFYIQRLALVWQYGVLNKTEIEIKIIV